MNSESIEHSTRLSQWLQQAADSGASDLHLATDIAPMIRVHGEMKPLIDQPVTSAEMNEMLRSLCPPDLFERFERDRNLDFAAVVGDETNPQRFRSNYFFAGNQMGACFRVIPRVIPELAWAGFPIELADRITRFRNGLILFSGVTGSGKSTSMAMMVKQLLQGEPKRIITIEDPIEYLFQADGGSLVTQREVGRDVVSFADGLKYGLRQDPDVILVGEIRDRETARIALSAAETGHLILATMHARDGKGAISRFVDLFPQSSQFEVRALLAMSLRTIVCQHLLPSSIAGEKRELALEVLFNTLAIAAAIRQGKLESIDNNIQTSRADGMQLLDDDIHQLWTDGRISLETAKRFVSDPRSLH
ncbi:MAG: PilT/PilU family type 4a pilus ATPase [Planctomycetota bacterium]